MTYLINHRFIGSLRLAATFVMVHMAAVLAHWTGYRAQAVCNRTSSAVGELHYRVTVLANTLRGCTGRDAGRSIFYMRNVWSSATHTSGAVPWGPAEAPADNSLKGEAEVLREERIDHRVHCRIAVAEPEYDREHSRIDTVAAKRPNHVHGKEGQPAEDEETNNNGQRLGGLRFHSKPLHLRFYVSLSHLSTRLWRVKLMADILFYVWHRFDNLQEAVSLPYSIQLSVCAIVAAARCRLLTVGGGVMYCEQGMCVRNCWAAQVLRGRVADRDLDLLVLIMPRSAELVITVWRNGRPTSYWRGRGRSCRANGSRVAVCAATTVWWLVEVCATASVNSQGQSLLFESISNSFGTCSIVD